ncbi:hypothetical protein H0H92_004372 [Tricholoma furcatifolium]|nr:hypothetical protein H0H92_004372 [Tricholoma furcatifolium]
MGEETEAEETDAEEAEGKEVHGEGEEVSNGSMTEKFEAEAPSFSTLSGEDFEVTPASKKAKGSSAKIESDSHSSYSSDSAGSGFDETDLMSGDEAVILRELDSSWYSNSYPKSEDIVAHGNQ